MPAVLPEVRVTPEVLKVLEDQHAEEEYRIYLELIAEWYPETLLVKPFVFPDPHESDWLLVLMRIVLPHTLPVQMWAERDRGFYREVVVRLPPPMKLTCSLYVAFTDVSDALA